MIKSRIYENTNINFATFIWGFGVLGFWGFGVAVVAPLCALLRSVALSSSLSTLPMAKEAEEGVGRDKDMVRNGAAAAQ